MRETHAFAIVKQLKALGHEVEIVDQPRAKDMMHFAKEDDAAIKATKEMTPEAIKACCAVIRSALIPDGAPYTIETMADKKRLFPNAAFAAW
jgi:UDP-glucose 6-dehydrogenase